jgi:hypothetical protein
MGVDAGTDRYLNLVGGFSKGGYLRMTGIMCGLAQDLRMTQG